MRVLMISKALVAGIYQRKLECIAAQGVNLLALTPESWRDERGVQPLERVYTSGYRLETLPIVLNGNFHLHFYPTLGRWMRDFRPDIVHIDEEPYNLSAWQALYEAKRVGAKTLFFSWQNIRRDYPPPFNWGERWMLRNVDYAIAGTESAAQVWRDKGYAGDMAVIAQFGIDPELFRPLDPHPLTPSPTQAPRVDTAVRSGGVFTIGCVARLVPEKGIDVLLKAAARLDGEWRVRIIGGGPEREALDRLTNKFSIADRVTFLDQIPSTAMPEQYRTFDVLAVPSRTTPTWKEQFGPRTSVEAMASGVPVVGSNSGAIPDVVGDTGLIVSEDDPAALANALKRLRDDPALYAELSRRGRERAMAHYTHDQVAQATVEVYEMLLTQRREGAK